MKIKRYLVIITVILSFALLTHSVYAQEKVFEASFVIFGTDEINKTVDNVTFPDYQKFTVNITDLKLTQTTFITNNTQAISRYNLRVDITSGNSVIYSTKIPFDFLLPESDKFVPVTETVLYLPYSENADYLKIYKNSEQLLSVELKQNLCNKDAKCGQYENTLSCPQDCSSGSVDGFCDRIEDGVCDKDCLVGDPDCYSYPKYDKFTPSLTTDFKKINKTYLGYLNGVKLGVEGIGQIDFGASRVDVSGADLDRYVAIEFGKISLDTERLPSLDKPATLTFFSSSDKVYKNGEECLNCTITQQNGTTVVLIKNFNGTYSLYNSLGKISKQASDKVNVDQWLVAIIVLIIIIVITSFILILRLRR